MAQCFYLDSRGRRCPQEAEEDKPFCAEHDPEGTPSLVSQRLKKASYRVAALLLLVLFLLPLMVQAYRILMAVLN